MTLSYPVSRGIDGAGTFALGKTFHGTTGADTQDGTRRDDTFDFDQGGTDTLDGRSGDDVFLMGGALDTADRITGGKGFDTVELHGDYSSPHDFSAALIGVEKLVLKTGFDYDIDLFSMALSKSANFVVDANEVRGHSVRFSAGATGHYTITGGWSSDHIGGGNESDEIHGGQGDDYLVGLGGADLLYGADGLDTFDLSAPYASSSTFHDTIFGYDPRRDDIAVNRAVLAVDASVDVGTLSAATFDADMQDWVDRHALEASHAVLFMPEHGDLGGHTFLIIDNNGKAGYQPNKDYVVELSGAHHMDHFDADNIIVVL